MSGFIGTSLYDASGYLVDDDGSTIKIANATSAVENNDWVLIVDTVILSLTIIGACGIMASMAYLEFKGRAATTRTRLVQSLVVSDLVMGLTGLIGSAMELAGNPLVDGTSACNGLGVMLVTVLWTEHLWTLTLAGATFLILIYPMSFMTLWLEKRWYYLWGLVWAISFGVGVLGLELYGYFPNGGICFYGSNAGLFSELMQFIPRGVVFIGITFFYLRLFVFLRRPDKIRTSYSDSPTNGSFDRGQATSFLGIRKGQTLSRIFKGRKSSQAPVSPTSIKPEMFDSPKSPKTVGEEWRRNSKPTQVEDIPPWERVELPTFQVDGQRYGGAAANVNQRDGSFWGDWKGFGGKKRPSTASSTSYTTTGIVSPRPSGSVSSGKDFPGFKIDRPSISLSPHMEADSTPQLTPDVHAIPLGQLETTTRQIEPSQSRKPSADLSASVSSSRSTDDYTKTLGLGVNHDDPLTPSTSSTRMAETPLEVHTYDPDIRRGSALTQGDESRRGSSIIPPKRKDFVTSAVENQDPERGDDDDGDDDLDLMRVLQQTAPPDSFGDGFAVRSGGEQYDYMPESMASYLNRKTALLMLWFPLGYILLFSVSLVRIIYDFISDNPSTVLRALSRWFIFAQGVLDAFIYGLVEWHTKRVVRKRVKKGTLTPGGSRGGRGSGGNSALMSSAGRRSQVLGTTPITSQLGHTVSFAEVEDPRSIHQQLGLLPQGRNFSFTKAAEG